MIFGILFTIILCICFYSMGYNSCRRKVEDAMDQYRQEIIREYMNARNNGTYRG